MVAAGRQELFEGCDVNCDANVRCAA